LQRHLGLHNRDLGQVKDAIINAVVTLRTPTALAALAAGLVFAPVAQAKLPGSPVLFTGQSLASGQIVTSPDGHYELAMGADGNLVEYVANPHGSPRPLFSSGTGGHPGASATLETTGALVVSDASDVPLWSDNATSSGCTNLDLQTDGNLVTYNSSGTAYWAANTESHMMAPGDELLPGQIIFGAGGDYRLTMDATGILHLDDSAGRVWTAPKAGAAGSYAEMNADGEFEVVNPTGSIAWDSATSTAGASMQATSTGELEVVDPSTGKALWTTDTSATRTGLTQLNGARAFTACPVAAPAPPVTPPPPAPTPIHPRPPVTGTTKAPLSLKLPGIKVRIDFKWTFRHGTSWISKATVARFPSDARLTVTCLGGHGCPRRRVSTHHHTVTGRAVFSAGAKRLHALLRNLIGRRFHAGDSVVFTVTEPHHASAGERAVIRDGRRPLNRPLPTAHAR
jgi:hypothetical protein